LERTDVAIKCGDRYGLRPLPWRGDAESINCALEDTLYLTRAHSKGRLRQTADLLGFGLMVNSLTLARHRAREAVKAAA
jgi:hypothetical protein